MTEISRKLTSELNKEQIEAVTTINGPVLVLAGAGTGKTRVITYRIAYMIETGIAPDNIAAVTFTNKAAREMKERLAAIVRKSDAEKVFMGTFHSFSCRFLRKEIRQLGYTPNFTIADEADQTGILKQVVGELGIQKELVSVPVCLALISKVKSEMVRPEELVIHDTVLASVFPKIYNRFCKVLKNQNMLDFDDLLMLTVKLLEDDENLLRQYQDQFRYLLVDEYQDTNHLQFRMLELLMGDEQNICVVGDDDQSIYGWRGAKIENILNFPNRFRNVKQVKLEQNYRSTNTILKVSNSLISHNRSRHEKELWSDCGDGENIRVIEARTGEHEAQYISDAIFEMRDRGTVFEYNDIAILYRSNYLSRQLEDAFRNSRIPYRLVGSKSFYERKEVRDAVAYLKLLVNPRDDQSLLRIIGAPPRGIGDKAIEHLRDIQNKTYMPLTEIIGDNSVKEKLSSKASAGAAALFECLHKWRSVFSSDSHDMASKAMEFLKEIGYLDGLLKMYKQRDEAEKRRDNVLELIHSIGQYENREGGEATLDGFIESYSLADDNDKVDEDVEDSVTLMTVHASKGLEFPAVFIVGLEESIFPNERAVNEGSLEEERRLFYVAITRAKKNLIMTRARERMRFGSIQRQRISSFISELPEEYVDIVDAQNAFQKVSADAMRKAFENFTF